MKLHQLKLRDDFWLDVMEGMKRSELRLNDRNYKIGDLIHFVDESGMERFPTENVFEITHILQGTGEYGLSKGYAMLSIKRLDRETDCN